MIRTAHDKSSDNINLAWMNAFNVLIEEAEIREISRSGDRFTSTNKQDNPIMCNLDRILMTPDWER